MHRRSTVLFLVAVVFAMPAPATMKEDVAAIRAARAASNAGIAAHDAAAATAAFDPNARVQASGGGLIENKAAMVRAFETTFADPKFVKFVRTSEKIEVGGDSAAETGHWAGEWRAKTVTGRYLARWNRIAGKWRMVGELYVPLDCKGADCAI